MKEFERDWFLALIQSNLLCLLLNELLGGLEIIRDYTVQNCFLNSVLKYGNRLTRTKPEGFHDIIAGNRVLPVRLGSLFCDFLDSLLAYK